MTLQRPVQQAGTAVAAAACIEMRLAQWPGPSRNTPLLVCARARLCILMPPSWDLTCSSRWASQHITDLSAGVLLLPHSLLLPAPLLLLLLLLLLGPHTRGDFITNIRSRRTKRVQNHGPFSLC